jgi:phytanoyl-CoA hydroxylase
MKARDGDGQAGFSELERQRFERDGYLVARGFADPEAVRRMSSVATDSLSPLLAPAEFEAEVHYPGAPASRLAPGGETPRRLLNAATRDRSFRDWAPSAALAARLEALMGGPVEFAQSHHNCIMTKYPGYSSATLWHQDIRYWSFDRPELVSTWLALGDENPANGSLQVIPGSHRLELDRGRLDAELFLRPELPENAELIATAVPVTLAAGDVLFFDAQTFHAAGTNTTDEVKLSAVFTYHRRDNRPIPGTRSANYPSLEMQGRRD